MNKTFKFMTLAVAAMSMAACSSEDALETAEAPVHWNADGSGYVAFNLSMSSSKSGRFAVKSAANDNFTNGDDVEYAVKNAVLLIFDGEEEATAKFHSAYTLDNSDWGTGNTATNPNVTVDNKFVVKLEGAPAHPKALVVLNNNGLFTVDPVTHALSVQGTNFPVGHSFSELANKTETNLSLTADKFGTADVATNGILMVNAPLFTQSGESQDPTRDGGKLQLLVHVGSENVYKTKAAALESEAPAASVYVERAVAKITVNAASDNVAETGVPFSAKMENWTLDNTNKSSFLVRNTAEFTTWANYLNEGKYRMVGAASVGHNAAISAGTKGAAGYRTYFAKDPNYDENVTYGTHTNKAAFSGDTYNQHVAMGTSQYCAENTFNVAHMTYGNTTRAIVKATIAPTDNSYMIEGKGFYSKPGDDKFYTLDQMKTLFHNYVNGYLVSLGEKVNISGTVNYEYTVSADHKTFTVKVTSGVTEGTGLTGTDKEVVDALIGSGKAYNVHTIGYDFYTDGVCYYDTRIQHFGQDYTPWTAHDASTVEQAYGTDAAAAAKSFLGRWGVLRNNWYELTVNSVAKIGYAHPWNLSFDPTDNPDSPSDPGTDPVPPYNPNTPDDNQKSELWLSVDVNILSWAKRTQQVDF